MIEDVAVEHPLSGIVVVANDDSRSRVLRNVQHVLPGAVRLRHTVAIEYLELKTMQMEWMVHADDVLDLPDLRGADLGADVHAGHVHQLAVDHTLSEDYRTHCRRLRRVQR